MVGGYFGWIWGGYGAGIWDGIWGIEEGGRGCFGYWEVGVVFDMSSPELVSWHPNTFICKKIALRIHLDTSQGPKPPPKK